ncbi:MAG: hypothetical protein J6Y31_04150 [Bacteroidales bacterium]|nr:hypothetical protein [Bacteroidales bacterium]MBP5374090.1 hypothetical protein [Bacteroidales bacterium]
MDYKNSLNFYPDFPIEGVTFVDVLPLLQDKDVFRSLTADLVKLCDSPNLIAPEARGFLFAAPMLYADGPVRTVLPVRKKGKLPHNPGDLVQVQIMKEYGPDNLYFRISDLRACVKEGDCIELTFFDDILATGGTAKGLADSLNGQKLSIDGKDFTLKVKDFVFLIEIDDLPGRACLEGIAPVKALIHVKEQE